MSKHYVKDYTLDEKIDLLVGDSSGWGTATLGGKLPRITVSDGPNGLRMHSIDENGKSTGTIKSVAFPAEGAMANSWDCKLMEEISSLIAEECIVHNADILLAPAVNIKRTPYNGRNYEYFSEDPLLAGNMAASFIKGLEGKGVGTSLKHFLCNNADYDRHFINNEVDERALREIYLRVFQIALKSRPMTVMCSYNPINGVYASENRKYLKDILRDQLGFDGLIMSDWGAVNNRAKSLKATLDLEMPTSTIAPKEIREALDRGYITEDEIDECAQRVLDLVDRVEAAKPLRKITHTIEERRDRALHAAEECIVVLKNNGVLPLDSNQKIAVTGPCSVRTPTSGGGSGMVNCDEPVPSLVSAMRAAMPGTEFIQRHHLTSGLPNQVDRVRGALADSFDGDTTIVSVGNYDQIEGEAFDRMTLKLAEWQNDLVLRTTRYAKKTVVVIHAGTCIDMSDWIDKVDAVVFCGFCGQKVNDALANILSGKVCPSGKLSETFVKTADDLYCRKTLPEADTERYAESVFVGYRWYDKYGVDVAFPFGHGLSYAKFEYSDLTLEKRSETDYTVSYTVSNLSDVDGAEISQLYVRDALAMAARPLRELKGYSRDFIPAHSSKRVTLTLDRSAFAYYSCSYDDWYVENGSFEIAVGASSRDLRLSERITVDLPYDEQSSIWKR